MFTINFIDYQGTQREIEAQTGDTLMETAVNNGVPGIEAECGGACACATCHVHIAPDWMEVIGGADTIEAEMLEIVNGADEFSRLACQIQITEAHDGLTVTTPESQF